MADDERLIRLIQGLHKGTMEGKIHWARTAAKGVYLTSFPEYGVRISTEPPGSPRSMAAQFADLTDARNYYVRIYNDNGDMLEEITDRQFTKTPQFDPHELMLETYNEARRQAMDTNQAIEAILKVLQ